MFVCSRNPFPPGEKVVSKGSEYVCQQCSAKETSSDVRGPKLESKSNVRYNAFYTCNSISYFGYECDALSHVSDLV